MMPAGSGTRGPYRNTFTWSFAVRSAQTLPCKTKYGRLVRLMVSVTSGSAACTRARTLRQMPCCQSGSDSMEASTRGSWVVSAMVDLGYHRARTATATRMDYRSARAASDTKVAEHPFHALG